MPTPDPLPPTVPAPPGADGGAPPAPPGRGASPLPPAEARRRRRELWMGVVVLLAILGVVLVEQRFVGRAHALPIGSSALFLFLNAVNVILILLLFFLIARNFVKLVYERRRGILGSHLNAKFVTAFLLIAILPTGVLFAVSVFFISSSIDTWFSLQVDRALDQSREVADAYYDASAKNALAYARQIALQVRSERLLREETRDRLSAFVQAKQREYNLGVVEVFSATGEELVTAINPEIPASTFTRADSDLVRSALGGIAASKVDEAGSGDVIRGAVPIESTFRTEDAVGAVVVNYFVPAPLARRVGDIRATLAEYRRLQPNAGHIKFVYLANLVLFFLVVVMFAIWWGFRLAKSVAGPIRALAEGTAEVARGNLDLVVETDSDDEVGFLVASFNRMTADLREARTSIERSNAEVERRRRYMEIVLRNVGAGVLSLDAEGRIATMNPSAQRLLGILPGTGLVGRRIEEALAEPEHRQVLRELAEQLRSGLRESVRRQVQLQVGDEVLTLLVTLTLLHDEEGNRIGLVAVMDDYSQLVKAQRMAAWREVARRIAHEIKNPLTPIQLSAQRLRRRFRDRVAVSPEDRKVLDECVDAITGQVETLKVLVSEFSNFARLPAANPKPDDLNRLVADAVASYAGTEGLVFRTDLDSGLPTVELDREQMRRVLTNLIDNAVAAIRERSGAGTVELRTVYDEPLGSVRLEIADDGVGIRPEDRRRVFEPYFSTKRQGTGLGLAIVSRIVADHRGYIRVNENRPRGTRFIVELPVKAA